MPTYLRRIILVLLVLTGIYYVASPFVVPWMVEKKVRTSFAERVDGTLEFSHIAFNPVSLTLLVRDVNITDTAGQPVLVVDAAHINVSWRTLWSGRLHLQALTFEKPSLNLAILEDGHTSLEAMLKPAGEEKASGDLNIRIDQLAAESLSVALKNGAGHKVAIGPLDLTLDGFATAEGHAIGFNEVVFALGGGKVTAKGQVGRSPLLAELGLTLSRVPLKAIMGFIPLDDVVTTGGLASGEAKLTIADSLLFEADFTVADFAGMTESRLVRRVQVPYADIVGFKYDGTLDQVSIDTVKMNGGVVQMVRPPASPEAGPEGEEAAGTSLVIEQAMVSGGKVVFEDQSFAEPPTVTLDGLGAVIVDLHVGKDIVFGFQGEGYLGANSPIRGVGYIDFRDEKDASISLEISKLDHTVLQPYLYRTLGRASSAGQAYLQFDYYIENSFLDGTNTFLFDRWEWGDKNPDYDGEEIPLKKAFNLLEGKGGRVEMEIPVDGEYLDPTFRVDGLVRRATNKFISNLITTPFRILGKLIPGGKKDDIDLGKVKFEPSSAVLLPLEKARLTALANALLERPKVRLQIDGIAVEGVDLVPTEPAGGEAAVNQQGLTKLANMRADIVYQYLIAEGLPPNRLVKVVLPLMEKPEGKKPIVKLELLKD